MRPPGNPRQEVLERLVDLVGQRYASAYDFAAVHAGLGDSESVLACRNEAYEGRSIGWLWLTLTRVSTAFSRTRASSSSSAAWAWRRGARPLSRRPSCGRKSNSLIPKAF